MTKRRGRARLVFARVGQMLGLTLALAGCAVVGVGLTAMLTNPLLAGPAVLHMVAGGTGAAVGSVGLKKASTIAAQESGPGKVGRAHAPASTTYDPHERRNEEALRRSDPDFTPNLDHMSPHKDPPGFRTLDDNRPTNYDARSTDFDNSFSGGAGGDGGGGDGGGGSLSATDARSLRRPTAHDGLSL
jgi:hypothetical protein